MTHVTHPTASLAFGFLTRQLLEDDGETHRSSATNEPGRLLRPRGVDVTARIHPTACVIVALPRDPRAARQAAEPMLGVAEAIPLDPIAVVASGTVALPGTARRVEPPAREGVMHELRVGLASLTSSDAEAAVIWPATHARVRAETVLALVDAFRRDTAGAMVPTLDGRPGMPVIVGRADWGALATADAPTVHDALRELPVVRELHVTDTSTVLESVDPSRVEK